MDFAAFFTALTSFFGLKGLSVLISGLFITICILTYLRINYRQKPFISVPVINIPDIGTLVWGLFFMLAADLFKFIGGIMYIYLLNGAFFLIIASFAASLSWMFFFLSFISILNKRIIHFMKLQCLGQNRCEKKCAIYTKGECKARLIFFYIAILLSFYCLFPMFLKPTDIFISSVYQNFPIEGIKNWFDINIIPWVVRNYRSYVPGLGGYYVPEVVFFVQFKIVPGIAFLIAITSIAFLLSEKETTGMILLTAAVGLIINTYFNIVYFKAGNDLLLGAFSYEFTKLLILFMYIAYLRFIFPPIIVESDEKEEDGDSEKEDDSGEDTKGETAKDKKKKAKEKKKKDKKEAKANKKE